jgi:hypothetical protein
MLGHEDACITVTMDPPRFSLPIFPPGTTLSRRQLLRCLLRAVDGARFAEHVRCGLKGEGS